jgi:hypothetical protein
VENGESQKDKCSERVRLHDPSLIATSCPIDENPKASLSLKIKLN